MLYMHLVFRIYFPGPWDPVDGLLAFIALFGFFAMVPVLLLYPCYLERFAGKRPVFLILLISIISPVWALANGLRLAGASSLLAQPLVVEGGILYFISFNLLYSHVFQLYEESGFYDWWKRTQSRLFYNDPPAHIRDFDKAASIYIGAVLFLIVFTVYVAVDSFLERRRWEIRQIFTPFQESRLLVPQPMPSQFGSTPIIFMDKADFKPERNASHLSFSNT